MKLASKRISVRRLAALGGSVVLYAHAHQPCIVLATPFIQSAHRIKITLPICCPFDSRPRVGHGPLALWGQRVQRKLHPALAVPAVDFFILPQYM
ncbi:hypothetical protein BJ170DRAFT_653338, partial [Xylariales sp. AK1849]